MLKQNTLAEATTELGFATETKTPLTREVTLEDGTIVTVEGVVPEKMATILGSHFVTPGEKYKDNGKNLNGVVQNYNGNAVTKNYTVEKNKTYKITFNDTIDPSIDLVEQASNNTLVLENEDSQGPTVACQSAYMIGVMISPTEVIGYVNEAVLSKITDIMGGYTDNTTSHIGWKNMLYDNNTDRFVITDTTTPIVNSIKIHDITAGDADHLDEANLEDGYSWLIDNVEEIAL